MHRVSFGRFLISGLISGVLGGLIAVILYLALSGLLDYKIQVSGNDLTQLYIVPIAIASILPNLIGSIVLFFIRRLNRPIMIYGILALIAALLNSVFSQTQLVEDYRLVAHILHFVVAILSIVVIPKLATRDK